MSDAAVLLVPEVRARLALALLVQEQLAGLGE